MTDENVEQVINKASAILESLGDALIPLTTCNINAEGAFIACVKSALAKNYGVNRVIADQQTSAGAFTLTASLRGLCEDIIFLRYIADKDKRDEIVLERLVNDDFRYLDKQRVFFEEYRPGQPVMRNREMDPAGKELVASEYKARMKALGFDTSTNIETMAKVVGLTPLYDYLYAATSATVHFNPHTLLRMGWGPDTTMCRFGIDSFSGYYHEFNRVYALLLFVVFCTRFASVLGAKEVLKPAVDAVIDILSNEIRWPEIVTHEEMNRRKPSDLYYILGSSMRRLRGSSVLWLWSD